ncbi:MAG TPA: hypothetical protein VGE24_12805, partial [Emticicia sp.]
TQKYTYQTLSAYQKKLFDTFLESEVPADATIENTLTNDVSLRTKTRVAQGLLFRNEAGDKEKAITILKWVLKNQYQDENDKWYGIWKTSVDNDRFDQNWREFIGCDLIIILHKFKPLLPQSLIKDIETGLIHAAKGAFKRNVGADYTNISIMSAFLMEYVGTKLSIGSLKNAGIAKAKQVFNLYQSHKTFSEYNSPTYYGVTLIGLALWRELAFSNEIQEMGKALEKEFWHEIAKSYNPNLKNMPGPYFRAYGMDMTKYFAITGIWIALALDDEKKAPLAPAKDPKYGEMSNLPTILNVGLVIPKVDLKALQSFSKPQLITVDVPNNYKGDSIKKVSIYLNKDWMMGGLWGNKRVWEQIKIGTIHWKASNGDIGWLAILGNGNTNVKVNQSSLLIYTGSSSAYKLEVLVYAPMIEKEVFEKQVWELAGIKLNTKSSLTPAQIERISSKEGSNKYAISDAIPYFYKVVYEIPANWNSNKPLIEISPNQ